MSTPSPSPARFSIRFRCKLPSRLRNCCSRKLIRAADVYRVSPRTMVSGYPKIEPGAAPLQRAPDKHGHGRFFRHSIRTNFLGKIQPLTPQPIVFSDPFARDNNERNLLAVHQIHHAVKNWPVICENTSHDDVFVYFTVTGFSELISRLETFLHALKQT